MTLGKKICKLRKKRKLTQAELGAYLGVSNKAVSKWESDQTSPDIGVLLDLAEILKTTVESLLQRDCEKENINDKKEESSETTIKFLPIEGNDGVELTKGTNSSAGIVGDIVIPPTYEGKPVKRIADKAFYMCAKITSVVIPQGIEEIGDNAFYACKGLTSVIIPDSVTKIGKSAFLYCEKLASVKMSANIKSVGDNAFAGCKMLDAIKLPDNVELGKGVFISSKP